MSSRNSQTEEDIHLSSYAGPRRLLHWGPLISLTIIIWIATFAIHCDLMYWPPDQDGGLLNLSIFITWVTLVIYYHYQSSAVGPGFVPLKWRPDDKDCDKLQYCQVCQGYKAPRSHHCRKCNRCVMKMDHHCPWINTCCGHLNHAKFTYFLLFAPIGCIHAFFILVMSIYYGLNIRWYVAYGTGNEPRVIFSLFTLIGSMFATGLSVGVTVSVGILFFVQMKSIIKNRTGIEDWIEQKAGYRDREQDFVYPYDLGFFRNIGQVLFRLDGWPKSDGFWWEVKDGCGQFDLTLEQMQQKEEKKQRAIIYKAVNIYSGSFFPITHGLHVCCCFPWSDEERIPLSPGENIKVTRWRKYWLYGDKILQQQDADDWPFRRVRGWFPRHCVVESATDDGATGMDGAGEKRDVKSAKKTN